MCVFPWLPKGEGFFFSFLFKPLSMTHFFSIGTDLAFIRQRHPADWEQQVHLWSEEAPTQKCFWEEREDISRHGDGTERQRGRQTRKLQHLITKWGLQWTERCRLMAPRREKHLRGKFSAFHWLTILVENGHCAGSGAHVSACTCKKSARWDQFEEIQWCFS